MAPPPTRQQHIMQVFLLLLYSAGCLVLGVASQSTASSIALNETGAKLDQTLLSSGGVFEVGFYNGTQISDEHRYTLAIWYAQITPVKTVVWMADRSMFLTSNAYLYLSAQGELEVYDGSPTPRVMWTSNTSKVRHSHLTSMCFHASWNTSSVG